MKHVFAIAGLAALAGCAAIESEPAGPADLAQCEANFVPVEGQPVPTKALATPQGFRDVLTIGPTQMAIATLSGGTACEDMSWTAEIEDMEWLRDRRMLGWSWQGYEAFGYVVADRAGDGTIIATGERPSFSPGGRRFAAIQVSEMTFGNLEGLGVWEMEEQRTRALRVEKYEGTGPHPQFYLDNYGEWEILGWSGDSCIDFRFVAHETYPPHPRGTAPRRFHSAQDSNWEILEGACP